MRSLIGRTCLIAVAAFILSSFVWVFETEASDWNQGTIALRPGPDETLTESGYAITSLKPGQNTTFDIILENHYGLDQTIYLSLIGPAGWTLSIPGAVVVEAGSSVDLRLLVHLPDGYPDETMDPTVDHPIRVEGTANITGDRAFTICIIDLQANLDHDLRILPENEKSISRKVRPGERDFFDIRLTNLGDMNDQYRLEVMEHQTGWYIQFREGGEVQEVPVRHDPYHNVYLTQVLVGVPSDSTPGESLTFVIRSLSNASVLYGVGTRSDEIAITYHVMKASSITLEPLKTYMEVNAGDSIDVSFNMIHSGLEDSIFEPIMEIVDESSISRDWDFQLLESVPIRLEVGEKRELSYIIEIPEDSYGIYSLSVRGSSDSAVVNPGEVTVKVIPRRDLFIQYVQGGPFRKDEKIRLEVSVSNQGTEVERGYLKVDRVPEFCGVDIPDNPITVPAGSSSEYPVLMETHSTSAKQSFTVEIILMGISDENGDWVKVSSRVHTIEFLKTVELNVTAMGLPLRPVMEGTNITINVTVKNEGDETADGATLYVYEVTWGFSNKLIEEENFKLDPGENITFSIEWTVRISAKSIKADVTSGDPEEIDLANNEMIKTIYVTENSRPTPGDGKGEGMGSVSTEIAFVTVAGTMLMAGVLTVLFSSDIFRYGLFTLTIPLYSKLKPEHLLSNRLRRRIYVYVQNHPGEHFRSILVNLNLTNGTLAHHLYTLEKEKLIRSRRDGLYRRFYPAGYRIVENKLNISPIQRKIMDTIDERPGLSQKDISDHLDISSSTVNYNIKSLKDKELIRIVKDGKMTRIFPDDENA